jgi:hypothetical protein
VSEQRHTPGPWTCRSDDGTTFADHADAHGEWGHNLDDMESEDSFNTASIAIRGDGKVIAMAVHADATYIPSPIPELAANARLIAAAPDLLAACRTALEVCNLYGNGTKMVDEAAEHLYAAIAKAEGGGA